MKKELPIRVLQIVDNIAIMSGVSSMIINIYRNIDRSKVQFDFLVSEKKKYSYEEEIKELGGNIIYTGAPLSRHIFSSNNKVRNFFCTNSSKYKIVHLHSPTISEFTIRHAKNYGINNIIVHSHSTMTSTNRIKSIINTILTMRIKFLANHYWACSTEAAYYLFGKNYCQKNSFELIYNAVDVIKYEFDPTIREKVREKYKFDGYIVALHISNFSPIKNHKFLVNVIKNSNSSIKYVFVGEGPEKDKFENELKNIGCYEKCVFLGKRKDIPELLQGADLVILPSLKEGLPVTVVEGQASGLPCIISDTITKDVKVNNVEYLPLNSSQWVDFLTKYQGISNLERSKMSSEFKSSMFNIKSEANRVMQLYLKMWS